MKISRCLAAAVGLGLFWPSQAARAQASGAAFLKITPSPRSYALGQSNVTSALGAQAIGENPANLGLMTGRYEVFSSYASVMSSQYEHLAAGFGLPTAPFSVDALGLAVTRLQTGGLQGADSLGNKTGGSFDAGDTSVSVSGAGRLTPNLRLGATAKALQSQIAGYRSNLALASDLGLTFTFSNFRRPISVGLSVTNLGQGIKFKQESNPLPTSLNMGFALPLGPLLAVAEVNRLIYDQKTTFGTGLEFTVGPVDFRGGFLAQSNGENLASRDNRAGALLAGLSAGIGVHLGIMALDYAMSQQGVEYGMTQRVGLSLRWGSGSRHAAAKENWRYSPDRSDWMVRDLGWQ